MNNAFEVWEELKKVYLKYIDTGLPIKYKALELERKKLLLEPDAICKKPIIELVPRYAAYKTLSETCTELHLDQDFANFAKQGLFPDVKGITSKIYKHQFDAIKAAAVERKNIIATTGTGSGKTECFLFPLLYDIYKEKKSASHNRHALRGLILYPLNALAEDQMRRLRKALSSDSVISHLNDILDGKRITFGRYTGSTPLSGKKTDGSQRKLREQRAELKKDWEAAKRQSSGGDMDYLFDITNLDDGVNAEYWDRWTMQNTPPDILITNYSMLNIMLMRNHEHNIFEETKRWLEEDPSHIFHLVIDELHSYRGTSGTEVAYLIRMLLLRLNLSPDSSQVQFLSSSASMQESPRTKKFITGFFGLDLDRYEEKFTIISGEQPVTQFVSGYLDIETYVRFKHVTDPEIIEKTFISDGVSNRLLDAIPVAKECDEIMQKLFGIVNAEAMLALEGLMVGLALLTNDKGDVTQPVRAHFFFRNLEGLWACSNPECSELEPSVRFSGRSIGKLFRRPQVACKCGGVVLEALLCRQCGEVYLGGWLNSHGGSSYLSIEREVYRDNNSYITLLPSRHTQTDNWKPCSYDWRDGNFIRTMSGSQLCFAQPDNYLPQYPNTCFNCEYSEKPESASTLTPIFRHYTGVQKVNQLMADTLMLAMRRFSNDGEPPKLVLFSDSRQSAAKLAAGIELDHYRDAVRAVLLNSLEEKSEEKLLLKKFWQNREGLTQDEDEIMEEIAKRSEYQDILYKIYTSRDKESPDILKFFATKNRIVLNSIQSSVIDGLFQAGINPGGSAPSLNENWTRNYDFEGKNFLLKNFSDKAKTLDSRIRYASVKEILIITNAHLNPWCRARW
jgi:DEAD/DEAH box helicase domain-containing protein